MRRVYDLHTHSTASDGTLAPAALVAEAQRRGIDVLALTDHDTTDGLQEAGEAAARLGLEWVPGVEVSVTWEGYLVHIVGLGIDPCTESLRGGLLGLQAHRRSRAEEIGRRLGQLGIADALEGASRLAGQGSVGRGHFARFLAAAGHAANPQSAFERFLAAGRPAHVAGSWATLAQAVSWIRGAGGEAVVAHPARYPLTAAQLRRLLGEFRRCGGTGLEVVSGSQAASQSQAMAAYAREFGLLASVGSDYHGGDKPFGRAMPLPAQCLPIWEGRDSWSRHRNSVSTPV